MCSIFAWVSRLSMIFLLLYISFNFLKTDFYVLNFIIIMNLIEKKRQINFHKSYSSNSIKCIMCRMNHFIFKCSKFKELMSAIENSLFKKIHYQLIVQNTSIVIISVQIWLHFWFATTSVQLARKQVSKLRDIGSLLE